MDTLKFAALSRALTQHEEILQLRAQCLFDRVYNYWSTSKTVNEKIKFSRTVDGLELVIPQCKFHCFGESRIKFIDSNAINEITFSTKKGGEKEPFVFFYLNKDNELTIPWRMEAPLIDLDYAGSFEEHFMNELTMAALKADLL
ncbi:hypothetical protein [Atlantibacter sp.]|uniref:hypothetical protein n=1 Tax=Atlantibacter sp. TaxID=1903473 RepID=UPI0028AAAC96|nr:hypothetical protein [Atlantibacter sp.]